LCRDTLAVFRSQYVWMVFYLVYFVFGFEYINSFKITI